MEKLERARELAAVSIFVLSVVKDQIRNAELAETLEEAKAALVDAATALHQLICKAEVINSELEPKPV